MTKVKARQNKKARARRSGAVVNTAALMIFLLDGKADAC